MSNSAEHPEVLRDGNSKPTICKLSRRQFMALTGAAVGAVGATALMGCGGPRRATTTSAIKLPDMPSHNPAYRGWSTPDGGLLLSTQTDKMQTLAYGMNSNGRSIWSLCDGTITPEAVASQYEENTGRLGAEAAEFLAKMMDLGVVVAGYHVVPAGRFPRPPAGGCYHTQTARNQDEGAS